MMSSPRDFSFDPTLRSLRDLSDDGSDREPTHGMMRRGATTGPLAQALEGVEATTMTPARAREILGHRDLHVEGVMTLEELATVRRYWATLGANASLLDALRSLAAEEDAFERTEVDRHAVIPPPDGGGEDVDVFSTTGYVPTVFPSPMSTSVELTRADTEILPSAKRPTPPPTDEEDTSELLRLRLEVLRLRSALDGIAHAPFHCAGSELRVMAKEALREEES